MISEEAKGTRPTQKWSEGVIVIGVWVVFLAPESVVFGALILGFSIEQK
jgi:hypothetical protein